MESPVHLKEVKYHLDELVKLIQSQQDWISSRPEVVTMGEVLSFVDDLHSRVGDLMAMNREMLFRWGTVIDQIPAETGDTIRKLLEEQYHVAWRLHERLIHPPRSRPLP